MWYNKIRSFFTNPFVVGISIIVTEMLINALLSVLFGSELGGSNISGIVIFLCAGMLVAQHFKQSTSTAYNLKVVLTYVAVMFLIIFIAAEGALSGFLLGFTLLLTGILALFSYLLFVWGQKITLKHLVKNTDSEQKIK